MKFPDRMFHINVTRRNTQLRDTINLIITKETRCIYLTQIINGYIISYFLSKMIT